MNKPQSSQVFSSDGLRISFAEHHAMIEAMSAEERELYWQECDERTAAADRAAARALKDRTLANRIKFSGIPEEFRSADVEICGRDIVAYSNALQNGGYESLIIRGGVGTGKTTTGCAVLNRAVMRRPVRFVTMARFKTLCTDVYVTRQRSKADVFDEYANVSLLMLDDLGKELVGPNTANTVLLLWELIDHRKSEHKPTIITTQYDSEALFKLLVGTDGDTATARAIIDRLKTYSSKVLPGPSKRVQGKLALGL